MTENEAGRQPDLARLFNLIMENPKLIAEISELSKKAEMPEETPAEGTAPTESAVSSPSPEVQQIAAPPAVETAVKAESQKNTHERRRRLLGALKPYLSDNRAKALDSIDAIANLLDVMKTI